MILPASAQKVAHAQTERGDNRCVLRRSTQHAHETAEAHWERILNRKDGHFTFLAAMEMLHHQFGHASARLSAQKGAVALEQQRLAALRLDLSQTPAPQPSAKQHAIKTHDGAWGALYALNGSALGATSLLRPGAAMADRPSAYLGLMRAYARSGALRTFLNDLNAQPLYLTEAVAGANAVFNAIAQFSAIQKGAT